MSNLPARFRLVQVTLAGFGLYERPIRFRLPPGPAVWVGPNESGKSTLVHGLTAILFGLPALSDPAKFGSARFRSLSRPREFWGELVWENLGVRYRLHRAFASHQVRMVEEGSKGTVELWSGEHNPKATSPSGSAFLQELNNRLGLTSLELFQQTFCLTQPLPEESEISQDLQHLLSGSRTGRVDDVQSRLFDQIRNLTLATGELNLLRPGKKRPANQREKGRIETLEESLLNARREHEDGRVLLDQLNANNQEMEETQERIREQQAALQALDGRLRLLDRWMELFQERQRTGQGIPPIQRTLEELDKLDREQEALVPLLQGAYAAFKESPPELPAILEALEQSCDQWSQGQARTGEAARERSKMRERAERLERELIENYGDVRDRPELPEIRGQWVASVELSRRRTEERARIEGQIKLIEEEAAALQGWEGINPQALRLQGDSWLRDMSRLDAILRRSQEISGQSEERAFLSGSRLQALREKVAIDARLKDLSIQIRECQAQISRELQLEQEKPTPIVGDSHGGRIGLGIGAVAGLAVAGALGLGLDQGWAISIGAGGLVFLLVWILVRALRRRRGRRETDLRPPETRPPESSPSESPRTESPRTGDAAPKPIERLRTDEIEWRAEEARLQGESARLGRDLGPYSTWTKSELEVREEKWRWQDEEQAKLLHESKALADSWFSPATSEGEIPAPAVPTQTPAPTVPTQPLAPALPTQTPAPAGPAGTWRDLPVTSWSAAPEFLRIPGSPAPATWGEASDWLGSLDATAWKQIEATCARCRQIEGRLSETRRELDHLRRAESEGPDPSEFQTRLAPFTLETSEEDLRRRLSECRNREQELHSLRQFLTEIPKEEESQEEMARRTEEVSSRWLQLCAIWPAAGETSVGDSEQSGIQEPLPIPGLPGTPELLGAWARRTRDEERKAREVWAKSESLGSSAARMLHAQRAEHREQLVQRENEQRAALGAVVREMDTLERSEIWLTVGYEDEESSARALRLRQDQEEVRLQRGQLAEKTASEERSVLSMLQKQASLEGRKTSNLAHLELRLQKEEEQLRLAIREKSALVLAFSWVQEAAESYSKSYRSELEGSITEHFRALTGIDGRRIQLDEGFSLSVHGQDGEVFALAQLSQGARDQLSLAIRLSVADLLTQAVPLPLIFDDPFVHYDAQRLEHLHDALSRLSAERQWILLTHREDLAHWGEPVIKEEPQNLKQGG